MLPGSSYSKRLLFAFIVAILAVCSGCGSGERNRDPAFRDSKSTEADAEAERLRKLQMVKVWIENLGSEKWEDVDEEFLANLLIHHCTNVLSMPGICDDSACSTNTAGADGHELTGAACTCANRACSVLRSICLAQTALQLTTPRSGPLRLESDGIRSALALEIPPQSVSVNAVLLNSAFSFARQALYQAAQTFLDTTDACAQADLNVEVQLEPTRDDLENLGEVMANSFVEAYHLVGEAGRKLSDAQVAVADWQRSTPSLQMQIDRAINGQSLSRFWAARVLIGQPGGPIVTNAYDYKGLSTPLCTSSELSSSGRRALGLLREAAPSPFDLYAIVGTAAVPIETVLDDVLARLMALGKVEATATLETIYATFDVTRDDFVEASNYLADEARAYSRSLSNVQLPDKPSGFSWWAATGTPAPDRQAAFYGALVRNALLPLPGGVAEAVKILEPEDLKPPYTLLSLADTMDAAISTAQRVLGQTLLSDLDPVVRPAFSGVVEDGIQQRPGRWILCTSLGGWATEVYGFDASAGLIVVSGEEGLECGVQGTVEGQPCDLQQWIAHRLDVNLALGSLDFAVGVTSSASAPNVPPTGAARAYLLKPRRADASEAPQQYVALAGAAVSIVPTTAGEQYCARIPVMPELEEQVGRILEPSRTWCAQSSVSCAGVQFDARLPLEDELLDDGSGEENSWRIYLDKAMEAADAADLLGENFVNAGISADERSEAIDLREHAQEVAVLQELENLQSICGTSVDMTQLDLDPGDQNGHSCTSDCGDDNFLCFSGRCIPNIEAQIDTLAEKDTDYSRLKECISESQTVAAITLGDRPVWVWHKKGDENSMCRGADGGAPLDAEGNPVPCPVLYEDDLRLPEGLTDAMVDKKAIGADKATRLDYFRSDLTSQRPVSSETCDDLRLLHSGLGPTFRRLFLEKIRATNLFHPRLWRPLAADLGWEARLGGYGALTRNGKVLFETGRLGQTGIEGQEGWPCNAAERPADCDASDDKSLFCSPYDCSHASTGIPLVNQRLRDALIALRLSLGMDLKNISFPFKILTNYGEMHDLAEATAGFTRTGPGGVPLTEYMYIDKDPTGTANPFPTIFRQDLDSSAWTNGWCWGAENPSCPGSGEQYYAWIPDASSGVSFATAALGDNMLDSYLEQRTEKVDHLDCGLDLVVFFGVGRPPDECNERTVRWISDWKKVYGPFDANVWTWADLSRDSAEMNSARADAWFAAAKTPSLNWSRDTREQRERQAKTELVSAIHNYLLRDDDRFRFKDDLTMDSESHDLPDLGRMQGLEVMDRSIDLGVEQVVDGLELGCHVLEELGSQPSCSLTAPSIGSAEDLAQAENHLQCLAFSLEERLGRLVLSNFPVRAIDALREESSMGSYPPVGGDLGGAVSYLRGALTELSDISPQITSELQKMSNDIDAVRVALERHDIAREQAKIEFQSMQMDRVTQCAAGASSAVGLSTVYNPGVVGAVVATCVNSFFQIELGKRLENLKEKDASLADEQAIIDFNRNFSTRTDTLARLGTRANDAVEQINAQLANIENLRLQAVRSLHRALYLNSYQAEKQMEINNAMRRRFNTAQIRYEKAYKDAQRMAFVAKLAVEQRLGMRLSDMKEKLPLVDAPSLWESSVCATQGINWADLVGELNNPEDRSTANYADAYIGDYVRRLEGVVDSYRMVNSFHEGQDTAVISLRDDVYRTRQVCSVLSDNLLYHAGQLDIWKAAPSAVGWKVENCASDAVGPLPDCVDARPFDDAPSMDVAYGSKAPLGYRVTFGPAPVGAPATCSGCGLAADTRISQYVEVALGEYVVSWYARRVEDASGSSYPVDPTGDSSVELFLADGSPAPVVSATTGEAAGDWTRYSKVIEVPTDQIVQVAVVPAANGTDPAVPHEVELSGIMLEFGSTGPNTFSNTDAERVRKDQACADTDGSAFRRKFARGCVKLCANGFDGDCPAEQATEYCYREAYFNLNQGAIESGNLLKSAGFALGNFNYRLKSASVNFVGTGLRDCTVSETPISCYGRGFIPYSLYHEGPFIVRNHLGEDFPAALTAARVEHARGLATERYISNPIGSADRELLGQYTRSEFNGRPLDGSFTVRVWDDEGVDFNKIEDIQVVLDYWYWTRFD